MRFIFIIIFFLKTPSYRLLNKLSPLPLLRPDPRESILLASSSSPPSSPSKSNLTKFLAACRSQGLSESDLFFRDDLLLFPDNPSSTEGLCRVAKTVLKLVEVLKGEGDGVRGRDPPSTVRTPTPTSMARTKTVPLPPTPTSKLKEGQGTLYRHGQSSRSAAAASTPNLARTLRNTSVSPEGGWRKPSTSRERGKERERPLPQTPTPIRIKPRTKERQVDEGDIDGYSPFQVKSTSKQIALELVSDGSDGEEEGQDLSVYRSEPASSPRSRNNIVVTKPQSGVIALERPPKSPLRKSSGQLGGNNNKVKEQEKEKEKGGSLLSWARKAASPVSKAAAGVIGLGAGANARDGSGLGQELIEASPSTSSSSAAMAVAAPEQGTDYMSLAPAGCKDSRWSVADSMRASVGDNDSIRDYSIGEIGLGLPPSSPSASFNALWGSSSPKRGVPTQTNANSGSPTAHTHRLAHATSRHSVQSKKSIQSVGSEASTTTTVITAVSSLLEPGRGYGWGRRRSTSGNKSIASGNGNGNGQFGTIRTMTTDLTDPSSLGRTEGSWVIEEMKGQNGSSSSSPPSAGLGRKTSSSIVGGGGKMDGSGLLDLTRVAEEGTDGDGDWSEEEGGDGEDEEEEGSIRPLELPLGSRERERRGRKSSLSPSPARHANNVMSREQDGRGKEKNLPTTPRKAGAMRLNLKQGKFPEDFIDVFGPTARPSSSALDLPSGFALGEEQEREREGRKSKSAKGRSRGGEDSPGSAPVMTNMSVGANSSSSPSPMSISPPRKRAIVGLSSKRVEDGGLNASPGTTSASTSTVPSFPRRPTTQMHHRSKHSIDVANDGTGDGAGSKSNDRASSPSTGLLHKESVWRETSPDDGSGSGGSGGNGNRGRVMLRRHSTKPGLGVRIPRNGSGNYSPRIRPQVLDDSPLGSGSNGSGSGVDSAMQGSSGSAVPFPRRMSGEHSNGQVRGRSAPHGYSDAGLAGMGTGGEQPTRIVRGRFQSDVEGASAAARRKATVRPNSLDELAVAGAGVGGRAVGIAEGATGASGSRLRSRFESMVNLGASDLLGGSRERDPMDGGRHRQRLVVREDGKPPTHFVSLLFLFDFQLKLTGT